jgi:hypothetical protein
MSDTAYNVRMYVRFTVDELLAMVVSALCIAFILQMRDLLFEHFGEASSIGAAAFMFIFVLMLLVIAVWVCKIVAIRLGHIITYQAHYPGLVIGLILGLVSVGYLPIFLPGGFNFEQPTRMRVGKFLGYKKSWEIGLICATFPLVMLLFIVLLQPFYLFSKQDIYFNAIVVASLIAIYSCIPAPFFGKSNHTGRHKLGFLKSLTGATFGLEVWYTGANWLFALIITVLFFCLVTFLISFASIGLGFVIFVISLLMGVLGLWIYSKFFQQYFREF